jgi:hypothetical protein
MQNNIIVLTDEHGKKVLICQFVIELSVKDDVNYAINLIRDMAKVDPEPEKNEKVESDYDGGL